MLQLGYRGIFQSNAFGMINDMNAVAMNHKNGDKDKNEVGRETPISGGFCFHLIR